MVLGYFELPDEDQPEPNIWHHSERLEEWFKAAKQRREDGFESVPSADEDPSMTGNELTKQLIGD